MRYFYFLGLMMTLFACGGEKEQHTTKASEFVMPPETAGSYTDTSTSGQNPGYTQGDHTTPGWQNGGSTPGITDPQKPTFNGDSKTPPFTPPKGEVPVAPVQTQKEVVKGYTPTCCLVQGKADLSQTSSLTGQQSAMGCYAIDDVCNVYPTQCLVVACPANLVL